MSMKKSRTLTLVGFGLALLFSMSVSFAQEKSKLKLEQFFDVINVADPQISPDGKEIIYTRGWVDKVNDTRRNELFIMDADGSKNRFFTKGSSPSWSPDGTRIAYLSSGEPSGNQLFIKYKNMEGATQITRLEKTPSNIKWSPDGKYIAFNMLVPYSNPWNIKMPEKPKGAKWTEGPKVITQLTYRRDRVGYVEEGFTHIFIVSAEGGTPIQVTHGNYDHSGVEWTPDGKEILFTSLRVEDAEYEYRQSNVYAVNINSKEIRQLTDRNGIDRSPVVSPDGKKVAYIGYDWTDDTFIENKLYVMDIDGKNPRELAVDFDRSPSGMFWASDNSGVYFNADYNGTRNLYFAFLRGGHRQVSQGNHL